MAMRVVYVSIGEGSTSQGEFWGVAEYGLEREASGAVCSRGQRVRDLDAGGGEYAGRGISRGWWRTSPTSTSPRWMEPIRSRAIRRWSRPWRIAARGKGAGTGPWPCDFGRIHTRCRTMSGCIARLRSWKPMRYAIPSRGCRCGSCARAFSMRRASTGWSSRSMRRCSARRIAP